jgi:hypothetical protein
MKTETAGRDARPFVLMSDGRRSDAFERDRDTLTNTDAHGG